MNRLNKELSLLQGVGLLTTSLLGTGIFIVPAIVAGLAGTASLWAWPLLTLLVLPVAFTFALLGRQFPHAGGAPSLIGRAFGVRMEKSVAFLFLAVIPVGLPAALQMTSGFWQALVELNRWQETLIQLMTLALMWWLGQRPARLSGSVQTVIALIILSTVAAIWWRGGLPLPQQPLLPLDGVPWQTVPAALAVMFWCFVGLEAFTHLGEEFRNPRRDFPLALLFGVVLAGIVYWACSVAVLSFGVSGNGQASAASLPLLVALLWGDSLRWVAVLVGYLACFASINIYLQGFARLIWSLADEGKLPPTLAVRNERGVPARALSLVTLVCALFVLLASWRAIPLEELMRYANGNFLLVYLLSMAAGSVLLRGVGRVLALTGTLLCVLVLLMLGVQALYALAILGVLLIAGRLRPVRWGGVPGS